MGSAGRKAPTSAVAGAEAIPPFRYILLDRVIEEFLYHHQQVSSPKTVATYSGHLGVFVEWLEDSTGRPPHLSDLTLAAADAWSRNLSTRPRRTSASGDRRPIAWESRRTYLRTLRTLSNWLPLPPHSYCAEPPLRHLLLPRPSDTYKMPLAEGELAQLLAAAKENSLRGARDTAMLLMLVDGGLWAMELAMLRIGDVTLESGLVLVSRGKGNRSRVVTVGDDTMHNLRRFAAIETADRRRAPPPMHRSSPPSAALSIATPACGVGYDVSGTGRACRAPTCTFSGIPQRLKPSVSALTFVRCSLSSGTRALPPPRNTSTWGQGR